MEVTVLDPLPIETSRGRIEQAVQLHQVVIIQAETGAGKSTRVPQYLLSCAKHVIVTQPRRIAAATVAQRVADEMGVELGGLVGYRSAVKNVTSNETRILFCTDGIEVMRQLFEVEQLQDAILVIDEAHEWNINLELLVAWFRLKISEGLKIRLVIMSATIEAELLSTYFEGAEVITSKGRTFPITEIKPKGDVVLSAKMLLQQDYNVLMFVPGKAEIRRAIRQLISLDLNVEILPLHADLNEKEQLACFEKYDRPKCVVATNVAQTSITVPDIDAVVDSGLERRPEVVDGVEGLYLRAISLADREQRKGRAGRVKPGAYIDCCPTPLAQRKMFPRAAILSRGLEGLVLQLACACRRPEDLKFFHKPSAESIEHARQTLVTLRCLDKDGKATDIGRRVSSLPLGVRYARMIVETYQQRGDSGRVDGKTLTLAVLLEEGGVRNGRSDKWKQYAPPAPLGADSDAFIELMAFEAAQGRPPEKLDELGIDPVSYERVRDARHRVLGALRSRNMRTWNLRGNFLQQAIAAGLSDHLYKKSLGSDGYLRVAARGTPRKLPPDTVVKGSEFIVGVPWNFQINGDFGPQTKRLLRAATIISPKLLERVSG